LSTAIATAVVLICAVKIDSLMHLFWCDEHSPAVGGLSVSNNDLPKLVTVDLIANFDLALFSNQPQSLGDVGFGVCYKSKRWSRKS
jgi:hypothetical protein